MHDPVNQPAPTPQLPTAASQGPSGQARPLPSGDLLRGGRSVDISHNGSVYRLQATRLGKLILTK